MTEQCPHSLSVICAGRSTLCARAASTKDFDNRCELAESESSGSADSPSIRAFNAQLEARHR